MSQLSNDMRFGQPLTGKVVRYYVISMIQERFVVYEMLVPEQWAEVRGFWLPEKAYDFAERRTRRTGKPTRVDWLKEEVTRNGRELLDAQCDVRGYA